MLKRKLIIVSTGAAKTGKGHQDPVGFPAVAYACCPVEGGDNKFESPVTVLTIIYIVCAIGIKVTGSSCLDSL